MDISEVVEFYHEEIKEFFTNLALKESRNFKGYMVDNYVVSLFDPGQYEADIFEEVLKSTISWINNKYLTNFDPENSITQNTLLNLLQN